MYCLDSILHFPAPAWRSRTLSSRGRWPHRAPHALPAERQGARLQKESREEEALSRCAEVVPGACSLLYVNKWTTRIRCPCRKSRVVLFRRSPRPSSASPLYLARAFDAAGGGGRRAAQVISGRAEAGERVQKNRQPARASARSRRRRRRLDARPGVAPPLRLSGPPAVPARTGRPSRPGGTADTGGGGRGGLWAGGTADRPDTGGRGGGGASRRPFPTWLAWPFSAGCPCARGGRGGGPRGRPLAPRGRKDIAGAARRRRFVAPRAFAPAAHQRDRRSPRRPSPPPPPPRRAARAPPPGRPRRPAEFHR